MSFLLRLRRFDRDVGLILAAFIVLIALENVIVGFGWRVELAGSWEMGSARLNLSPIALALALPTAVSIALMARLIRGGRALSFAILGLVFGAALGVGVSTGRHFASSLALRAPFVIVIALASFGVSFLLARVFARIHPRLWVPILVPSGVVVGCATWAADAFVLRRLYPAFHLALLFITLVSFSSLALLVRRTRAGSPIAIVAIVIACASIAWSPFASKRVSGEDNLRRVLLEHAPILSRAVVVAAKAVPPPPIEDDESSNATLASLRSPATKRKLGAEHGGVMDWRGHDIVVVTIDALRADHVSAYGYERKTTPNIDALAARGVRFDHAYCPTPHTSYSIASMMTGKYMKPLLALNAAATTADDEQGQGSESSETWAGYLRLYGYRTAAFYPPAVFFIDEHRFTKMRDEHLGFEYVKEEFAPRDLRRGQIEKYLNAAPKDKPLFLWVHLFEPHEPYEMHPEHPFEGEPKIDAYDSEVAEADDLVGDVVHLVEEKRPPGTVFIVSADHGEEHGDHGGQYHGTTVYEEQVRVPLIITAPKVAPHVVSAPVQTIDLLPTSLVALDVPIPPRIRGRDLGPAIAGTESKTEQGLAFAETDDYTLVARGSDRLVCARKIASCTLFDVAKDPLEKEAILDREPRVLELKKLTAAIQKETGKVEVTELPDALRRGLQGDRDAAEEVAPLLDDAKVDIRRAAARCAFKLKAPEMSAQLRRALANDEDAEVRRWSALALMRLGDKTAQAVVESALKSGTPDERSAAALALAERGDARGDAELVLRWTAAFLPDTKTPGELSEARDILAAFTKIKSRTATPVLVRSLEDVRLRPFVVDTLAELGDGGRAKGPLINVFTEERYVHLRPLEARALLKLGVRNEVYPPLARFAGTPDPMLDAIVIAREGKLLAIDRGGQNWVVSPAKDAFVKVRFQKAGAARLIVLSDPATPANAALVGEVNGAPVAEMAPAAMLKDGAVYVTEVGELRAGDVQLRISSPPAVRSVWLVPRAAEIPPPPPRAWTPSAPSSPDPE